MDAYMKEAGDSFLSGSSVRGEVKLTPAVLVDEAVSAYLAAMKPGATLDELKHALKLLKPSNKKLTSIYTMTRMC
jgi:UDP-N-acetylmuramyl pentapeptide synthase